MDMIEPDDYFARLASRHHLTRMNLMDEYATLRLAYAAGATIQAWHLLPGASVSSQGRWVSLDEPTFVCPVHLYRVKPESES